MDLKSVAIVMFFIIVIIFFIVCGCEIYTKAGREGFEVLIPFYNNWVLYDIIFGNGFLMLITFIPFVGGIFYIISMFKLAKVFGKGFLFGLLLIFLPFIAYPILAFGDADYVGP